MNNIFDPFFLVGALVAIIIAVPVTIVTIREVEVRENKKAVIHGCAHYDAQTAAFTWNDEVKK